MGYSRKEEIAKLRQQRREAKASKKRKEKVREKLVRFLIVCEGTKTEPHYFEALIKNYISTVREVTDDFDDFNDAIKKAYKLVLTCLGMRIS